MSETDRELLELAAKSSGLERTHYRDGCFCYTTRLGGSVKWNPLTDDGDALRLAVKLRIEIERSEYTDSTVYAGTPLSAKWKEDTEREQDIYMATRRAIVRAAAEIGKAMNG